MPNNKMLKKGQTKKTLLGLLMLVVVLLITFMLIKKYVADPLNSLDSADLNISKKVCEKNYIESKERGLFVVDSDMDSCVDSDDPCLGSDNNDIDLDGLPDGCETEKGKSIIKITECEYVTEAGKRRCCTKEYHDNIDRNPDYETCKKVKTLGVI